MKLLWLILVDESDNIFEFMAIFYHAILAVVLHTEHADVAIIIIRLETGKTVYFAV